MNNSQIKRYQKIYREPFYLLEFIKNEKENLVFNVSGSTANIYQVTVYSKVGKTFCSCPDAKSWARKQNCVCKHVCFILFKVLKFQEEELKTFFQNNLTLTKLQFQHIFSRFTNISLGCQDYVNQQYLEKYNKIKSAPSSLTKFNVQKDIDEELECMICFDEIDKSNMDQLVGCPICLNLLHKNCMEKWLKSGKKTCIYCRSEVWKNYCKTITNNTYKNLLEE